MSEKEYEVRTCSVCIPCELEKCKEQPCHKVHRNLESDQYICSHGHDITFKFQRERAFATKFYKMRQEHKECEVKREKLITSHKQKLDEANMMIGQLLLLCSATQGEYNKSKEQVSEMQKEQESNRKIIQDMNQLYILTQSKNVQLREIIQNMQFHQLIWLKNIVIHNQVQVQVPSITVPVGPVIQSAFPTHFGVPGNYVPGSFTSPPVMPSATALKEAKEKKKWKDDWKEFERQTEATSSSPFSARQYMQQPVLSSSSQQPDEQDKELKNIKDALLRSLSLE